MWMNQDQKESGEKKKDGDHFSLKHYTGNLSHKGEKKKKQALLCIYNDSYISTVHLSSQSTR